MASDSETLVAVFTKSIEHPHTKTRLAEEIGRAKARACYRETLIRTIQIVANHFHGVVYVEGSMSDHEWLCGLDYKPQIAGDLGERMLACFEDGVKVLLGGDCPLVDVDYIQTALDLLNQTDVVFGPTEDGGYFLVGMNQPHSELFLNMTWSHAGVLQESLKRCEKLGLRAECLDEVWDIDCREDYLRWLEIRESSH